MPPGDAEPPGDAVPTGDAVPPGDAVPTGAAKPPVPPSGPEPAPTPAGAETTAAATAPTDGALPDREALTQAWTEKVLPTLKGLTKATYAAGHFEDTTDAAVFAVPGAVHRDKCEERRGEVEAALARHFGRPIPLRLVVAGETGRASDTAKNPRRPNQSGEASGPGDEPDPFEEERMDVGDLSELEDAPPDNRTPLDRLAEAFPGSDLVEEP